MRAFLPGVASPSFGQKFFEGLGDPIFAAINPCLVLGFLDTIYSTAMPHFTMFAGSRSCARWATWAKKKRAVS